MGSSKAERKWQLSKPSENYLSFARGAVRSSLLQLSKGQSRNSLPNAGVAVRALSTELLISLFATNRGTTMSTADHHPTLWYSEMSPGEKSTFWACIGGWMLDAMDVQMFSFAIPAIVAAFAITNADVGLIGTVKLLSSAL